MGLIRSCPECHLIFEAELPPTGVLVCPRCNTVLFERPSANTVPNAAPPPPPSTPSARQMLRGVAMFGAVFFFAAGLGYAYYLRNGIEPKAAAVPAPAAHAPAEPPSPALVERVPSISNEPTPPVRISRQPRLLKLPPSAVIDEPQRPSTLSAHIKDAIDRGVAYLQINPNNCLQYRNYIGLLGLALLECGGAGDDPPVQQIAAQIRSQDLQITQTSELTLAILFLDRLGDPHDGALIRRFGQRLLEGQFDCGAWSQLCRANDPQHLWDSNRYRTFPPQRIEYRGDNSNTQLAILGLWVAQRHGVRARSALLTAERYFRNTQLGDGSWSYTTYAREHRDAMTCGGLMSLAMRHGLASGQGRDLRPAHRVDLYDAAVLRGLRYLTKALDKLTVSGKRIIGAEARDPLSFLWSLERIAIIYDLKKIGEREWYPWTAQMLVDTQRADGSWSGRDDLESTCYALLVLKRSNFTKDLMLAVPPPSPSIKQAPNTK